MKIGFDARPIQTLGNKTRGIGRYAAELLEWLPKLDPELELVVFLQHQWREECEWSNNQHPVVLNWDDHFKRHYPLKRTLRSHYLMPRKMREYQCDMFHFVSQFDAPMYNPKKSVVTVLDLIPLLFKGQWNKKVQSFIARRFWITAIRNAYHLIAISENTKNDIVNVLGVDKHKITVIYPGIDPRFRLVNKNEANVRVKERHGLTNYLMYTGGLDYRKNVRLLLQAFKKIAKFWDGKLVIVSDKNLPDFSAIENYTKSLGIEKKVLFTGFVPDDDLVMLYNGAIAFLFPSLYEGFGFPPLEAMACGTPVISTKLASLKETLGDAVLAIEPTIDDVTRAVTQLLSDEVLRKKLSSLGPVQAAQFTWERAASETLELYKEIAGE